jgi:hypothetical protein
MTSSSRGAFFATAPAVSSASGAITSYHSNHIATASLVIDTDTVPRTAVVIGTGTGTTTDNGTQMHYRIAPRHPASYSATVPAITVTTTVTTTTPIPVATRSVVASLVLVLVLEEVSDGEYLGYVGLVESSGVDLLGDDLTSVRPRRRGCVRWEIKNNKNKNENEDEIDTLEVIVIANNYTHPQSGRMT